jgi:3-hydroxybutyryl-CoA dehydratase
MAIPRLGPLFEEVSVGDTFAGSMTITESHLVIGAGLFGDFSPLHVDEEFARRTRFGTRIAHGPLITGIMAGVLSTYFAGTAIGYLSEQVRFLAPVFPGSTVTCEWRVTGTEEKRKLGGGVVALDVRCVREDDVVVLEGAAKLIIRGAEED